MNARREALRAERVALGEAAQQGLISEAAYRQLLTKVDKRLDALFLSTSEEDGNPSP